MEILKADGTRESFNEHKLDSSLKKAGANATQRAHVIEIIKKEIVPEMRTQDIYRKAFELLREYDDPIAAKYSLRRAVFSLGPTGFPFEDFLGKVFESEGYTTKRRLMIKGTCVTHEIDLAAYSPDHSFVAEAKFHSHQGIKSDLQTVLYSRARFLDLESKRICEDDTCGIISYYVITNTKFTSEAIKYAECVGLNLLSWNYPHDASLRFMIERSKLYPITVLTDLSIAHKEMLLRSGIILCDELYQNKELIRSLRLPPRRYHGLMTELAALSRIKKITDEVE